MKHIASAKRLDSSDTFVISDKINTFRPHNIVAQLHISKDEGAFLLVSSSHSLLALIMNKG